MYGSDDDEIKFTYDDGYEKYSHKKAFEGVINNLERRYLETDSDWKREEISQYQSDTKCERCKGFRLKEEALCVKIDKLNIDGKEMVVNILAVGRIGMFYQTKDEQQSGFWNNETSDWEEVSGYRTAIRDGIRMAKKLAPTDMLLLPVIKGGAR